jgi:hypothetical protein
LDVLVDWDFLHPSCTAPQVEIVPATDQLRRVDAHPICAKRLA